MVSIISSLRSIRFRLILVVILVVSALLFQTIFLISTQDLQSNFENEGDLYLTADDEILLNLDELSDIMDKIELEQVATLIGDILFSDEVDVTFGQTRFTAYVNKLNIIQDLLAKRQDSGYVVESQIENGILQTLTLIQDPKLNETIINDSQLGISSLFNEYNATFIVERNEYIISDTGEAFPTGKIIIVDRIEEAKTEMAKIREAHNENIEDSSQNFENTTGFVSIISSAIDISLALFTNDTTIIIFL